MSTKPATFWINELNAGTINGAIDCNPSAAVEFFGPMAVMGRNIEQLREIAEAAAKYSDYTVQVSNEPSYYGTDCTQEEADRIAASLRKLIEGEFPGIDTELWRDGAKSSATTGPDAETVEEINDWIANNWTAAL